MEEFNKFIYGLGIVALLLGVFFGALFGLYWLTTIWDLIAPIIIWTGVILAFAILAVGVISAIYYIGKEGLELTR